MVVCRMCCALPCGDELSIGVVCVMAAEHRRPRKQTLLFYFCTATKPGGIMSTTSAKSEYLQRHNQSICKDDLIQQLVTQQVDSAVARELVGVRSVFWKPKKERGLGQNARL
jgi:hypothetical protein